MESPTNTGLRAELYAPERVWCDEIDAFLAHLDPTCITTPHGRFALLDGIYDHIGKYAPLPDTTQPNRSGDGYNGGSSRQTNKRKSCEFQFLLDDRDRHTYTYWMNPINSLEVTYETVQQREYEDLPETAQAATQSPDFSNYGSTGDPYYMIGGLLVDPLVTDDAATAANHVNEQLAAFADRICYVADLERFTAPGYGDSPEHPEEYTGFRCPVSAYGIGEKTTQNLARCFGVYSNILFSDHSVSEFTSPSFGTRPDPTTAEETVKETTERYRDFYDRGVTRTDLQPEDLTDYPKPAPAQSITTPIR
ncbi:hypothetical protein [Salinibaculum rarum]|uniref:hypothetical protein n=1 Tax=Salinibaculum rarum TaxID=3058903 RepID=UPI00265E8A9A|nr:hypothetical protein [Salinibaculum sp. KK48]